MELGIDMTYDELLAKIREMGVHEALGPSGKGLGIEQNPHELATFLAAVLYMPPVRVPVSNDNDDRVADIVTFPSAEKRIHSILEVGTGYKAGLVLFLHKELGLEVATIDVKDYGHTHQGIVFYVEGERKPFARQFDAVIIDADKTYEAVEADYVHYASYGDKVVAICGIAGLRGAEGVTRFWKELAYTKKGILRKGYFEAIDDTDAKSGIGWKSNE